MQDEWSPYQGPLTGKRVLVTRSEEQAPVLSSLLTRAGALPIEIPVIRIEPPESWEPVDRAIARLGEYDWIIFTSANGVRSFLGRLGTLGMDAGSLEGGKIAVIGPATSAALTEAGLCADLVPREFVAESLLAELTRVGVTGKQVLLARAAEARDVLTIGLREQGAQVDVVALYRTRPAKEASTRLVELLTERKLDVVTLASSSSVRQLADALGESFQELLGGVVIACIGPVTAGTALELGMRADLVAEEYTMAGLVSSLERFYRERVDRSGIETA